MKNNMQRVIGNIVILTPVIVGLVFYKQLPNQIAIHFNVEEQANGFMNRNLAIVALPFIGSIISVVGKTTVEIIELFECKQKVP